MHVYWFALSGCVLSLPTKVSDSPEASTLVEELTEPCEVEWYFDDDGDGYPSPNGVFSCEQPSGTVAQFEAFDCDDTDAGIYPSAPEICDGEDQDCDGDIDNGLETTRWYLDGDGDGAGAGVATESCRAPTSAHVSNWTDCDDNSAAIYPDGPEHCDGADENCNGLVDEDPVDGFIAYPDDDGDGYGSEIGRQRSCEPLEGLISAGGDCHDFDALIHPEGVELCNGIDDDCNGVFDDGMQTRTYWPDLDGDGHGDDSAPGAEACIQPEGYADIDDDCDDTDVAVHPNAVEWCNGWDDDCDGTFTEETEDFDGDGFTLCDDDCNDASDTVFPGAPAVCDAFDNDCNGITNEAWLDTNEPNDARGAATFLGGDDTSVTVTGTLSGPDDDDWFMMDTIDDPNLAVEGDLFHVSATVTDLPPGVQVSLHLYRRIAFGQVSHVDQDDSWQDGTLHVERSGSWIGIDGDEYWVQLEVIDGYDCDASYTIEMSNEG